MNQNTIIIHDNLQESYNDTYTPEALSALAASRPDFLAQPIHFQL